jgi:Fic family protein
MNLACKRQKGGRKVSGMSKYSDIVKLWQSFDVKTEADLEERLDNFKVLFAYNSNKIENESTTYEDTYEVFKRGRVSNYTGDVRTLTEIQNQKTAYQRLVVALAQGKPIGEKMVLEFHRLITEGTYDEKRIERKEKPGTYKQHHYVIGKSETGAAPETVPKEMGELLDEVSGAAIKPENVLIAAAYFHAKFENIHPFADGNGRTGRILLNYFLILNNHPPLTVYDEDRTSYYQALGAFDSKQEVELLRSFLEQQTIKTWEKTLGRENKRN